MEIICINSTFSPDTLEFYKEHGVSHPEKDKIYHIKDVRTHTTGRTGVILEEINNPMVPIKHPILGTQMMEVTFDINRFRTLSGEIVKKEELKDFIIV